MLLTLPRVLDEQALYEARKLLAAGRWTGGRHTAGRQSAQVKDNEQLDPMDAGTIKLQQLVLQAMERHLLFFSAALPKKIWPPAFNRYAGGQTYGDHVDQAIRTQAQMRLRSDLSCTLFLSQPDEYEGGELVTRIGQVEHRVKGRAGDAVLYLGHTVHRVEPVTRGERLASFFWIESLVRDPGQRELLFNMDQALTALRSRDGESAEAVALMGTYHHLLRMWSDT
ncbi:MAG: Fe2+-dependent dioxygenase [Burkholderiales bacterium]|nr:Fe2+-dependent dioxygenase [Burkholderiales bacterium]